MNEFVSRKFVAKYNDEDIVAGKVYNTILNSHGEEIFVDDNGDERDLEYHLSDVGCCLIPVEDPEPETQALQIEEGKSYITRDGRKVGPVQKREHDKWPFDLDHFKQEDLPDDLACTLWNKHGKSVDGENLDLISEYKESEIKVGDLYTFVGEETFGFGLIKGVSHRITQVGNDGVIGFEISEGLRGYVSERAFKEAFSPQGQTVFWQSGEPMPIEVFKKIQKDLPSSPIQTTTVKKIISGDYGRLHVDSDGYHSLNLSIIDGKSRCVSVDEMLEMIDVLTLIVEAREG